MLESLVGDCCRAILSNSLVERKTSCIPWEKLVFEGSLLMKVGCEACGCGLSGKVDALMLAECGDVQRGAVFGSPFFYHFQVTKLWRIRYHTIYHVIIA